MAPSQRCIIMRLPRSHTSSSLSSSHTPCHCTCKAGIACTCKYRQRIVMVRFLYRAALVDYYPVIPLMVFQVIVMLLRHSSYITLFSETTSGLRFLTFN